MYIQKYTSERDTFELFFEFSAEHWAQLMKAKPMSLYLTPTLDADILTAIEGQQWEKIEIIHGIREGRGVFAKENILPGTLLCNYGGIVLSYEEGQKKTYCDYMMEVYVPCTKEVMSLFHSPSPQTEFTFGKYINHSKKHPNITPKLYLHPDNGVPEVLFFAQKRICAGEQLCWNYGNAFMGVSDCVDSCKMCSEYEYLVCVHVLTNIFVFVV